MSHDAYIPTLNDDMILIIRTSNPDFDEQRVLLGSLEFYLDDVKQEVYVNEKGEAYSDHIYRVI